MSDFIKLPLKEGDTVESIAKEYDIEIEYLLLMHNQRADMDDKIFTRFEGFPSHVTEYYIYKEVFEKAEKKEQVKTDKRVYPEQFYEKRNYGFTLERYEKERLKNKPYTLLDPVEDLLQGRYYIIENKNT